MNVGQPNENGKPHTHTHANEIQTLAKKENALAQSATKIITEISFYCENARRNSDFSFLFFFRLNSILKISNFIFFSSLCRNGPIVCRLYKALCRTESTGIVSTVGSMYIVCICIHIVAIETNSN